MYRTLRLFVMTCLLMGMSLAFNTQPTQAQNNIFYVSPTGRDSNPGTEAQPFLTINHAVSRVGPGGIVYVMNGTYSNIPPEYGTVVSVRRSGTSSAYITIMAYPGHKPKIVSTAWNGFRISGQAYIEINGFEIECIPHINSSRSGNGIGIENRAHHIRIINNHVHGCGGGGIYSVDSDYLLFENNRVHDTSHSSSYGNSGISIYHSYNHDNLTGIYKNIIRGNIGYRNENRVPFRVEGTITDGNCIILDDLQNRLYGSTNPPYVGNTLVENNICFNNGGRGIHVHFTDNVTVRNNTLYMNNYTPAIQSKPDHGELTAVGANNVDFYNNVVVSRPGLRAFRLRGAQNIRSWNNIFYGTTDMAGVSTLDRIINPNFVNASLDPNLADFRPQITSPMVDTGSAQLDLVFDIEGRSRAQGDAPDIGAYEYCTDTDQ